MSDKSKPVSYKELVYLSVFAAFSSFISLLIFTLYKKENMLSDSIFISLLIATLSFFISTVAYIGYTDNQKLDKEDPSENLDKFDDEEKIKEEQLYRDLLFYFDMYSTMFNTLAMLAIFTTIALLGFLKSFLMGVVSSMCAILAIILIVRFAFKSYKTDLT